MNRSFQYIFAILLFFYIPDGIRFMVETFFRDESPPLFPSFYYEVRGPLILLIVASYFILKYRKHLKSLILNNSNKQWNKNLLMRIMCHIRLMIFN